MTESFKRKLLKLLIDSGQLGENKVNKEIRQDYKKLLNKGIAKGEAQRILAEEMYFRTEKNIQQIIYYPEKYSVDCFGGNKNKAIVIKEVH